MALAHDARARRPRTTIDSAAGFRVISARRGSLDPPQDRELRGNSVRRSDVE
jgi:hypothetical protein